MAEPHDAAPTARARLDAWQRRHVAVAFPLAVVRKFLDDRASTLAALIAYYAFFSIFPLLLVFVSVLGFVLEGDAELQADVLDSALARIPVIGDQLRDEVHPITGSTVALVVGLVGALWAGLGVTTALGRAFEDIWDVPRTDRPGFVRSRVRGLAVLAILAIVLVGSTVATGLASQGAVDPVLQRLALLALAFALNGLVFLAVFGLLTAPAVGVAELLPGVAMAAIGAMLLQAAGGWYVDRAVTDATATYGTFALVIGLLSWFWLGAHLLLFAAEVNVVRQRRLWPRSFGGELLPADRAALRQAAESARQDDRQEIAVTFDDGEQR